MVQRALGQIKAIMPEADITIATAKTQVKLIKRQLNDDVNISVEPCRKDTFPAIALVSAYLHEVRGVDLAEPIIICPVDPYVELTYFEGLKNLASHIETNVANIMLMEIKPIYKLYFIK